LYKGFLKKLKDDKEQCKTEEHLT